MNAVQLLCSLALILVASFRIFAQEPELPLKEQVNTDEGTICVYERGEHREKCYSCWSGVPENLTQQ